MTEITSLKVGAEVRKIILSAVNKISGAANLTLGPEGRNAILPRTYNRGPRLTNDGITVMENARLLRDDHERLVAELFIEGSKKTNELAGDGTTTTCTIASFLVNQIFRELPSDTPTASLQGKPTLQKGLRATRGEMKEAKDLVIGKIKEMAKPIKTLADLEKIAIVSIGKEDEETAKIVAKTVWEIGRDAAGNFVNNHIDVVEGYKREIETEVVKGMRFPAKVAHRAFVNNLARFEMVAEDCAVFITNFKLDNPFLVVQLLERFKQSKIALFAPEFSLPVIQSLIQTTKNGLFCYPVQCPALRTEQLNDLAVYTGATVVDKDNSKLENAAQVDLGFAGKIVVKDTENKEDAVLLDGKGTKIKKGEGSLIDERIKILQKQILESRNELTTISLQKRIANLSSAVGIIRVGATTSAEGLFLKLKIEDGVYSCKAALEEGYVEGGGLCLKKIAEKLPKSILTEALKAPYEQIQKNAGGQLEIGKEIIDPAKVVRLEVEHGVSIAASIITTEILIPERREMTEAEGLEKIARSILKGVYFDAKHASLLKENEDEAEKDRMTQFENIMLADTG